jgi:hypothetical protein
VEVGFFTANITKGHNYNLPALYSFSSVRKNAGVEEEEE